MIIGSYDEPSGQSHYPMGRVTHICVSTSNNIGSDNGLSPWRRQAITWTKCWDIVNWTRKKKLQGNLNRNSYISMKMNLKMSYQNEKSENVYSIILKTWKHGADIILCHSDVTLRHLKGSCFFSASIGVRSLVTKTLETIWYYYATVS